MLPGQQPSGGMASLALAEVAVQVMAQYNHVVNSGSTYPRGRPGTSYDDVLLHMLIKHYYYTAVTDRD